MSWPDELELLEVGAAGGGCLWFTRKVYDKLVKDHECQPFDRFPGVSEDHSFFKRCRESNIKAYLAPKIQAHHLRVVPVTENDCNEDYIDTTPLEVGGFA